MVFLTAYSLLAYFHFYLEVLSLNSEFLLFSLLFYYYQLMSMPLAFSTCRADSTSLYQASDSARC